MPNRMAQYFDDEENGPPGSSLIGYRSLDVQMDQGDHLMGKVVAIAVFLIPAIMFAIVLLYAWMIR